jgi:hypothetical protein
MPFRLSQQSGLAVTAFHSNSMVISGFDLSFGFGLGWVAGTLLAAGLVSTPGGGPGSGSAVMVSR